MKQVLKDLVILLFIFLTLIYLWFSRGLIFAGGEEEIPFYDLNKTTKFFSYTWQDVSAGYPTQLNLNRIPYFSFLESVYLLGIPGFLVQAMHFFIIMSTGTIAMYLLLRETVARELEKNNLFKLIPLIGAIFYLLNPFSMNQIWGRGIYIQFFPFALFPFILLMFILGLKNKNFVFGVLGLLSTVFFAGAYGNPSYIISMWAILFLYLLYYIIKNKNRKEILFSSAYFLCMIIGWVVVHFWWIYPFLKLSSNQFSAALNNWNENIGTLKGVSKDYPLTNILRLIHAGYIYRDQQYGQIYLSVPFILLSWVIPLVSLFSYTTFKKLKIFLFFKALFLFSLFICIGSNFPTGWLFELIFKLIPPLQAFRNPFEKFGVVLTIAYSPFFAIGSVVVSQWISTMYKKISSSLVLLFILVVVCGIYVWPIWTGQFAGGIRINPWVKVPEYYKSLDDWLNEQKDDGRIIHFPINPGDGLKYSDWEHPYQGSEPGEYIFTKPSIGKNSQSVKSYYSILLQRFNKFSEKAYGLDPEFINSEFRSDELYQELAKLNVRYIILHKDIDPDLGKIGDFESVAKYLDDQKNIKKINTFGKLDVYKVDIPNEIQLIYSPTLKVNYSKINPTRYTVSVTDVKNPFELYFLENFDSNWEVYIDDQRVEDHGIVFSYANKWSIDETGSFKLVVKYKPQDFVDEGMRVTKSVILIFSLLCLAYFIWKIWKRKS